MPLLALLVAAVLADRLLVRRGSRRWRRLRPLLVRHVRRAPATFTYLFVLLITSWVLTTSSPAVAERLLLERSTNLHHLARDPVRVLVGSAFWLGSGWELLVWAPLFALSVAPVERAIGSLRAIAVFFAGHVGATLLTAAGLWIALRLDAVERSVSNAKDVGASYGFLAVVAAGAWLLTGRARLAVATVLLAATAAIAGLDHTFTAFGHLLSVLIGLACSPLVGRARGTVSWPPRRRRRPEDRGDALRRAVRRVRLYG